MKKDNILKPGMAFRAKDKLGNNYPYLYLGKCKTETGMQRMLYNRATKQIITVEDQWIENREVHIYSGINQNFFIAYEVLDTKIFTYLSAQEYCNALLEKPLSERYKTATEVAKIIAIFTAQDNIRAEIQFQYVKEIYRKDLSNAK